MGHLLCLDCVYEDLLDFLRAFGILGVIGGEVSGQGKLIHGDR